MGRGGELAGVISVARISLCGVTPWVSSFPLQHTAGRAIALRARYFCPHHRSSRCLVPPKLCVDVEIASDLLPFRMLVAPAKMLRNRWGVPLLHTVGELAEFLEVPLHDLQWFADRRGMQIRETKEQLHHYTYRWIPKRDGSFRLLEQPKPRLKHLQRIILQRIVGMIPVHDAAHGFVSGLSAKSAALPHVVSGSCCGSTYRTSSDR